jgi:hypothetical protein
VKGSRLARARLVTAALLIFCTSLALARPSGGEPVVAIAPMKGPSAKSVEVAVQRALKSRALVLGPKRYLIVAKNLIAVGSSPEDIAAVATELGASWVVTGVEKRDGRKWNLSVSLRDAKTGRARARLKYPLPGPRISGAVLHTFESELVSAFDDALQNPEPAQVPPTKPRPAPTRPTTTDATSETPQPPEDTEAPPGIVQTKPPEKNKPAVAAAPVASGRPRWARWFELAIGPSLTGRHFTFSPSVAKFTSSVEGGIHFDGTFYPFAFSWNRVKGVFSGIGLTLRVDKPFWPASTTPLNPGATFPTTELRVEGGLNWKFTLVKGMPRPQLHLIATAGLHEFNYAKGPDGTNVVGVPDVAYTYVSVGGGLTVHFAEWSWIWLDFVYHAVLNSGPIETHAEYGYASQYGLRFQAGLDFLVYKGIRVGAMGFYERFGATYGYDQTAAMIANTSTDEYYGAMLLLGYDF